VIAEVAEAVTPLTWGAIITAICGFVFGGTQGGLRWYKTILIAKEKREEALCQERRTFLEDGRARSDAYRELIAAQEKTFADTVLSIAREHRAHTDELMRAMGQSTKRMLEGVDRAITAIREESKLDRDECNGRHRDLQQTVLQALSERHGVKPEEHRAGG
jgi:hypothetical protein